MTNNRNRRSTRRSFGRRALAFGVAMFAMVTLTAVGFAAWLISSNSTAEGNGGVVTQTVTQQNIKITIDNLHNGKLVEVDAENYTNASAYDIIFAPKEDAKGLVSFDGSKGDKPEALEFSFKGTLENWDRIDTLTFAVKVPESILTAAGLTRKSSSKPNSDPNDLWTYTAASAYVQLPEYALDKDGKPIPKVINGVWDGEAMTGPVSFSDISSVGANLVQDVRSQTEKNATPVENASESTRKITITAPSGSGNTTASFRGENLAFGWGARYSHENPATSINAGEWSKISSTGIEADKAWTNNMIQLELIKLQAVINNVNLESLYSGTVKIDEADKTITIKDKISALGSDKTIEDWVKSATSESDKNECTEQLGYLQAAVQNSMTAPSYTLYIRATVE